MDLNIDRELFKSFDAPLADEGKDLVA